MNHRQTFLAWLRYIVDADGMDEKRRALVVLTSIVGRNQNGPEHGADGSFTEREWTVARDAVNAWRTMLDSAEQAWAHVERAGREMRP